MCLLVVIYSRLEACTKFTLGVPFHAYLEVLFSQLRGQKSSSLSLSELGKEMCHSCYTISKPSWQVASWDGACWCVLLLLSVLLKCEISRLGYKICMLATKSCHVMSCHAPCVYLINKEITVNAKRQLNCLFFARGLYTIVSGANLIISFVKLCTHFLCCLYDIFVKLLFGKCR